MATYNLSDLVGKTYFAVNDIGLTRLPYDNANAVFNVSAGQPVGVVYSYLLPKEGRTNAWLMFYDKNMKPYYVPLKQGQTDVSAIQQQGVKSTQQQLTESANKNKTFLQKLPEYIGIGILIGGAFYLAGKAIETHGKKK